MVFYATFTIDGYTFVNQRLTDISKGFEYAIVQIDGDKHIYIPLSRCQYILEHTPKTGEKPPSLEKIKEMIADY